VKEPLRVTVGDVAGATAGSIAAGEPGSVIDGFSIDTRTLRPGDLYIALRGERLDGHVFVTDALKVGARGVLVSDADVALAARRLQPAAVVLLVGDTLQALQTLARQVRRRSGARVVAITGSAGKTTTKEVAAEFLEARYSVFKNKGNLNNHIGLPLSLLELRQRPEVAVVELGMNHAGEIRALVAIAEPEIRVWTNVGEAHLEYFGTIEAIAEAKAEILEQASPDHVLVANANDRRVMAHAPRFAGRVVTFGIDTNADVQASGVRDLGIDGTRAHLQARTVGAELRVPLTGRSHLANVLAAAAVAMTLQVPLSDIVERASALRPAPHRGEVLRLRNGITVIDDSYNSNPTALEAALDVLGREARGNRRLAVLGEMLELGDASRTLHERCGRAAAAAGLQRLITVGGAPARALGLAAVRAGLPARAVTHTPNSDDAASVVVDEIQAGDLVLVKGSRGVRTDVVVERLKVELA
jgi:UDP-N-acetylmuramoyl-tripeptide--D-alanyl-D-alanine ligase